MCSFDIISPFTNDYRLMKQYKSACFDELYLLPDPPLYWFKDTDRVCYQRSHFNFYGKHYEQTDGVAIGPPLGPVFPNIFICYFEEKWVATGNNRPSIWLRYVDDTFLDFSASLKLFHRSQGALNLTESWVLSTIQKYLSKYDHLQKAIVRENGQKMA